MDYDSDYPIIFDWTELDGFNDPRHGTSFQGTFGDYKYLKYISDRKHKTDKSILRFILLKYAFFFRANKDISSLVEEFQWHGINFDVEESS